MRTVRSHPSRWTQNMLRKVERFRRVAVWSQTPGMRFHMWRSPLRRLRERLWLLSRLQPLAAVHLNVSNPVRILAGAPGRMFLRIMNRSWVEVRRFEGPETRILSVPEEPANASVVSPAARLAERHLAPLSGPAQPGPGIRIRQAGLRVSPAMTPVAARLARRKERAEELPSVPRRLVQRPAVSALNQSPRFEQGGSRFASSNGFEPTRSNPAWPPRADAAPPLNVEQLTDQVLKNLDRRLIASRERLGRI
jgi:hypothetical protein